MYVNYMLYIDLKLMMKCKHCIKKLVKNMIHQFNYLYKY